MADENDVVRVPSGTRLRFGAGTRWVEKTAGLLPLFATNDQFGSDPAPGTRKKVQRWQPAGGAAAPAGGDAGCTPQAGGTQPIAWRSALMAAHCTAGARCHSSGANRQVLTDEA